MGIAEQKLFLLSILSLPNLLLYDADSILQFNINQLQSFDLNLNSWDESEGKLFQSPDNSILLKSDEWRGSTRL